MTSDDHDNTAAAGQAKPIFSFVAASKPVGDQVIIACLKNDIFLFGVDHQVAITHTDGAVATADIVVLKRGDSDSVCHSAAMTIRAVRRKLW